MRLLFFRNSFAICSEEHQKTAMPVVFGPRYEQQQRASAFSRVAASREKHTGECRFLGVLPPKEMTLKLTLVVFNAHTFCRGI